ncbi:universal stress protein [Nocardia terpenica]|uniref:universal stress protein n=1 Tax=Nocardia terpenica TaxID=455432 RepID=UPI002FDFF56A
MVGQLADIHRLASAEIVVGVDGSDASERALDWAVALAAEHRRVVRVVHGLGLDRVSRVFGRYAVWVPPVLCAARVRAETLVERCARRARDAAPGVRVDTEVSAEGPAALLRRLSGSAYLTVLGAAGTNGLRTHLGTTLLAVTAHGFGSIAVVRTDSETDVVRGVGPVVVGVDGSAVSEAALGAAFEESSQRGAELVAVHVWNDANFGEFAGDPYLLFLVPDIEVNEHAVLAERLAGWQEKYPEVTVTRSVATSSPAGVLRKWSESAQLVVVGSRGRGGFRGLLLGSTSNSLVQHACCPIMIVHPAM